MARTNFDQINELASLVAALLAASSIAADSAATAAAITAALTAAGGLPELPKLPPPAAAATDAGVPVIVTA